MDRRKNQRLNVQLPARYSIPRLRVKGLMARTVNMSRSGLLIECLDYVDGIAYGDAVEIEIDLPAVHTLNARYIHSVGHMVRIDRDGAMKRIALALAAMEFRDAAAVAGMMSEPGPFLVM